MTTTLTRPGTAPAAAFGQLVRNEVRLAWRQPTSLIGGLALAMLALFGLPIPLVTYRELTGWAVLFGFLAMRLFRWE